MEASPGTTSNPDGTVPMRVSLGWGVAMRAVDIDADVDVIMARGIMIGNPC